MKAGDRVKVRLWTAHGTVLDVARDRHGEFAFVRWDDDDTVEEVDINELEVTR